jgi:hypothetical protein
LKKNNFKFNADFILSIIKSYKPNNHQPIKYNLEYLKNYLELPITLFKHI